MPATVPSSSAVSSRMVTSTGVLEPGDDNQGLVQHIDSAHGGGCYVTARGMKSQPISPGSQVVENDRLIGRTGWRTKPCALPFEIIRRLGIDLEIGPGPVQRKVRPPIV